MDDSTTPNKALLKRIKRRVVARTWPGFVVCAPGLAERCATELTKLGLEALEVSPEGVGFSGRLHDFYAVNLWSRLATRVLLRLDDFEATSWHALENKLAMIDWPLFLPEKTTLEVKVSAERCRLYHSGGVEERLRKVVGATGLLDPKGSLQRLMLRGKEDRWTLSIDTSGAPLYLRGLKVHGGAAPIRETLAAHLLEEVGYDPEVDLLLDPMCGSGTFSFEAASRSLGLAPGRYRDFAFMSWPSFQAGRWRHLCREADETQRETLPQRVVASDKDTQAIERLQTTLSKAPITLGIESSIQDFFSCSAEDLGPRGVIVLNPPYGQRISRDAQLYKEIGQHLARAFPTWRALIIAPDQRTSKALGRGYDPRPLLHGGQRVWAMVRRGERG